MSASSVTASVFTALLLAASLPLASRAASAADLYGEGYGEPPYDDNGYAEESYPYDDEGGPPPPRYRDRYGEAPPPDRYPDAYDAEPQGPPAGSIKDGYPVPMPPPRYSERDIAPAPRHVRPERYACLDRHEIRHRLHGDGWTDIHALGGNGGIVRLHARRIDSGRVFRLRVDRCSGEVLAARPHYLRSFGAYRERPWPHRRWSRHY